MWSRRDVNLPMLPNLVLMGACIEAERCVSIELKAAHCLSLWKRLLPQRRISEAEQPLQPGLTHFKASTLDIMYMSRKADPEKAKKELKRHLVALGAWIGFVRVLPYALQALQDSRRSA